METPPTDTLLAALLVVMALTALLRLVPGTLWPTSGSDAGSHLLFRREIRRNRMRVPARIAPYALDERFAYPWFYHWLLAFVPQKWLERLPALPSAVIDALHSALVFGLAVWLAPLARPGLNPVAAGTVAGLLFGTAPALLAVGFGPRAYEITPRPFGELLFSAAVIAGGMFMITGAAWAAAAAVLSAALLLLSSKFAAQVVVFCVPLIALFTGQWVWLLLPPAALAGALLLSGGRYWWVLSGQLAHLAFYRKRTQYENTWLLRRNRWRFAGEQLKAAFQSGLRDLTALKKLAQALENNSYIQFALRNILWVGALFLLIFGVFPHWADAARAWERWLLAWMLAPAGPFVLTSLKDWRFLGEAERYPEYGLAPVCVLAAIGALALSTDLVLWLFALYLGLNLPVALSILLRHWWKSCKERGGAPDALLSYLKTLPQEAVLLPIPVTLAFTLASRTEQRFLVTAGDPFVCAREYDHIFDLYPWPSIDLGWWRRTYGAQFVVVQTAYLREMEGQLDYHFDHLLLTFDDGKFQVYAFGEGGA